MQLNAIFRFLSVCLIALTVLIYNFGSAIKINTTEEFKTVKNNAVINFGNSDFLAENSIKDTKKEDSPKESEKEEKSTEKEENKAESTTQVSAAAVKGNIKEQYISPYSAGLSYNNVYVKNSTGLDINLKTLLSGNLGYKIEKNTEPQVLIMHTHTTETYVNDDSGVYREDYTSRTTDNSKNMAEIGRIIAEKLNKEGIKTLHDTTQHDYPQYSGSYTRSAKTVNSYLKKYPSIKIVLDLHRDAISAGGNDKVKLVTEINGKKAAQVMLVMGSQSGSVTNFPNWKENLKLALKLQQTMEVKYPTLARPLSLMSKNYNQSLSNGSLLIEFGTDANSLEEAKYSAELVGESLITLLNNLQ